MKKSVGKSLGKAMPSITESKAFEEKEPKDLEQSEPDEFETKEHLHNIVKAHEIMSDPEKMEKVHKLVGRHQKAITSLKDVEEYRQNKYGPKKMKG